MLGARLWMVGMLAASAAWGQAAQGGSAAPQKLTAQPVPQTVPTAPKAVSVPALAAPRQGRPGETPVVIPTLEPFVSVKIMSEVWEPLRTESEVERSRSAVVVGDRAVVVFATNGLANRGGRPWTNYRLVAVDLRMAAVEEQLEFASQSFPALYLAADDKIVVTAPSWARIQMNLSPDGVLVKDPGPGHVVGMTTDGTQLARWRAGEGEWVDTRTLTSTGKRMIAPEPASVSHSAVVSTDGHWSNAFPTETAFVTLYNGAAPLLLRHGGCAQRPSFLGDNRLLLLGCGKATVIDLQGNVVQEIAPRAAYGVFVGMARDGSRFAIAESDFPLTDPGFEATEFFTIYDGQTYAPVGEVKPDNSTSSRAWAAFAPDGKQFLTGDARAVVLYRIP